MEDLIEAYLSVYEDSDITSRAKAAVDHQRHGDHGDDDALNKATNAVKKATKYRGPKVTPSLPESVDLYDVVLEHLLDEGYAETKDSALIIMANMSEAWIDGILDEAQIMSVSGPGGLKHMINRNVLKAQNAAARERQERQARNTQSARAQSNQELASNTRKSIRNLNVDPNSEVKHGQENVDREGYGEVPTDYRARRRRASGR